MHEHVCERAAIAFACAIASAWVLAWIAAHAGSPQVGSPQQSHQLIFAETLQALLQGARRAIWAWVKAKPGFSLDSIYQGSILGTYF